jgi:hypothetical protein
MVEAPLRLRRSPVNTPATIDADASPGRRDPHATAARVAIGATGLFIALVVAAHLLHPDLDPALTFISHLAIGRHGWVMQAAFLALAAADLALLATIRPWLEGWWGRGGAVLFFIGALGVVLGGLFVTDPLNAPPAARTTSGQLHDLGGGLGLCGFVGSLMFAATLWGSAAWRSARPAVGAATALLVLGFLYAFVSIATLAARHNGVFGPDTPIGWPNRIGILSGCVWIVIIAWHAARLPPPVPAGHGPGAPSPTTRAAP